MSEPVITLENANYSYSVRRGRFKRGGYNALESVSLELNEGETLGILGRNGAGKSTLLRLLAGIYLPSSGVVRRHRRDLTVSLLTLQAGFSPELSGRDNAIMGAMLLGRTRAEAERRLPLIAEFSGLSQWMGEPLNSYSSGMRARLGFSVAMEMAPDVLLVDEVLGVGDIDFRKKSTERIHAKIKSGQTVVLVTHSIPTVRELCTRLAWLENGRIQMQGEVEEVLAAYQEAVVGSQTATKV